jgi:outer membrane protein assembly factor BamD
MIPLGAPGELDAAGGVSIRSSMYQYCARRESCCRSHDVFRRFRPLWATVALPESMLRLFRQLVSSPHGFGSTTQLERRVALRLSTRRWSSGLIALVAISACSGGFRLEKFGSDTEALYAAGVSELGLKHWGNAISAFEKLTTDLPARDTLLPRAQFNLGRARTGSQEHLLAAQAYTKFSDTYPEDSLADDALFESARAYQKLWRSAELDSQYGVTSQATFRTLVAVYPDSPQRKEAERQLLALDEMFATKEYLAGYYYFRRKAYDPAVLYFKTVVNTYPTSAKARDAYLRMIESYRAIRYAEEASETCTAVRQRFAADAEVQRLCPTTAPKDSTAAVPSAAAPAPVKKP